MKMKIAKVCKPIVLSLCMGAWLLAGNAHAANSHLYPAVGCQEMFPDHDAVLDRSNGVLESVDDVWVTCPIVIDTNSVKITVTVSYEAALFVPPTYAGKPLFLSCELQGYNISDGKSVNLNIRNKQILDGSLTLSMAASHQFNVLHCYLLGTKNGLYFQISGYQVDES
jgi:hypothetical protein